MSDLFFIWLTQLKNSLRLGDMESFSDTEINTRMSSFVKTRSINKLQPLNLEEHVRNIKNYFDRHAGQF